MVPGGALCIVINYELVIKCKKPWRKKCPTIQFSQSYSRSFENHLEYHLMLLDAFVVGLVCTSIVCWYCSSPQSVRSLAPALNARAKAYQGTGSVVRTLPATSGCVTNPAGPTLVHHPWGGNRQKVWKVDIGSFEYSPVIRHGNGKKSLSMWFSYWNLHL